MIPVKFPGIGFFWFIFFAGFVGGFAMGVIIGILL